MGQTPVSYHNAELQITCHVIALHPDHDQVLLIKRDDGLSLPGFLAREHATGATLHVNRAMLSYFGIQTVVLRQVSDEFKDGGVVDRFYAVEVLQLCGNKIPGAHWAALADLCTGPHLPPVRLQQIREFAADRQQQQESPLRLPWTQHGWHSEANRWILEHLDGASAQSATIEQITGWEQSCVLRVAPGAGRLFLKALPKMYAVEIAALEVLAPRFGSSIPATVATSTEDRWLLMKDFGGQPLMTCSDPDTWHAAIQAYVEMQQTMSHQTETMLTAGIPARPLGDLPQLLADLLDDDSALLSDQAHGVSSQERDQIRAALPEIDTYVQCLARLGLPDTLEHGDLHPHNINVCDDGLVFYDWTFTAVTHPLLSIAYLGQFLAAKKQAPLPVAVDALQATYLAAWSHLANMPDLQRGLRAATILLPLYWALTYHLFIMPFLEPRDRWLREKGIPFHLRQFLTHRMRAQ